MQIYNWEIGVVDYISSFKGSSLILELLMYSASSVFLGVITLTIFALWTLKKSPSKLNKIRILLVLISFILSDLVSRFLFKVQFQRSRPKFIDTLCDESNCYGFVSSHASDFFAIATILILYKKKDSIWLLPLGIKVCISRMYYEDHYPLDLIGGILVGMTTSLLLIITLKGLNIRKVPLYRLK